MLPASLCPLLTIVPLATLDSCATRLSAIAALLRPLRLTLGVVHRGAFQSGKRAFRRRTRSTGDAGQERARAGFASCSDCLPNSEHPSVSPSASLLHDSLISAPATLVPGLFFFCARPPFESGSVAGTAYLLLPRAINLLNGKKTSARTWGSTCCGIAVTGGTGREQSDRGKTAPGVRRHGT
ncbi:hypothetical protein FB451DRAFT_1188317 [Mycena latifolia]|nr:hypothetical protein FB451DRAFT_1188317 [Mycena latifolia]